jgi:signal peptidase II
VAPMLAGRAKLAWVYGPAAAAVALDQGTKTWVREAIARGQEWPLAPGVVLTHVINQGGAFSLLYGQVALLIGVSVAVTLGLVAFERTRRALPRWQAVGLGILLGGTVGNLVDRLIFHHVTDFLDVAVAGRHWPTFNVADVCINAGVAVLAVGLALGAPPHPSQEDPPR